MKRKITPEEHKRHQLLATYMNAEPETEYVVSDNGGRTYALKRNDRSVAEQWLRTARNGTPGDFENYAVVEIVTYPDYSRDMNLMWRVEERLIERGLGEGYALKLHEVAVELGLDLNPQVSERVFMAHAHAAARAMAAERVLLAQQEQAGA